MLSSATDRAALPARALSAMFTGAGLLGLYQRTTLLLRSVVLAGLVLS
jgi:hypothetical protein